MILTLAESTFAPLSWAAGRLTNTAACALSTVVLNLYIQSTGRPPDYAAPSKPASSSAAKGVCSSGPVCPAVLFAKQQFIDLGFTLGSLCVRCGCPEGGTNTGAVVRPHLSVRVDFAATVFRLESLNTGKGLVDFGSDRSNPQFHFFLEVCLKLVLGVLHASVNGCRDRGKHFGAKCDCGSCVGLGAKCGCKLILRSSCLLRGRSIISRATAGTTISQNSALARGRARLVSPANLGRWRSAARRGNWFTAESCHGSAVAADALSVTADDARFES